MFTKKCGRCKKEFKNEREKGAEAALRMHIRRVHTKTLASPGNKKKPAASVREYKRRKPAPVEFVETPDVTVLCDVIVRLLAHIREGAK